MCARNNCLRTPAALCNRGRGRRRPSGDGHPADRLALASHRRPIARTENGGRQTPASAALRILGIAVSATTAPAPRREPCVASSELGRSLRRWPASGISELFPVSSLGHSVIIPAMLGGSWARDLNVSAPEPPYLAFIVGLHVATALALITYFWRDWLRIVAGLVSSLRHRRVGTPDERLAWLLVLATIPVGVVGLFAEHVLRTTLAKPNTTAALLIVNGMVLLAAEAWHRSHAAPDEAMIAHAVKPSQTAERSVVDGELARMPLGRAVAIGTAEILGLGPGLSRSGMTMVAGLVAGLDREQAARFAFLLATPVILAAGALKGPDLMGPLGDGIRGQALLASVLSFVGAYLSVRFLTRYFRTRSMRPLGYYCVAAGIVALVVVNA